MRKSEYTRHRKTLDAERIQLEASLAKVQAKLAALDLVWGEVLHDAKAPEPTAAPSASIELPSERRIEAGEKTGSVEQQTAQANGHTGEWVETAIQSFTGPFDVKDVLAKIAADHPGMSVNRSTVSGKLVKLADSHKLTLVQAGSGRRASRFRRPA